MTAGVNSAILASVDASEKRQSHLLLFPAIAVVSLAIAPFLWLGALSFVADGQISLEHYARMLANPSYITTFVTTLQMSAVVTAFVVLLGFPAAYAISLLPHRLATAALTLVAIPFWTSLLVRTYAWMVLLQRNGLINTWAIELGLVERPMRLANSFLGTSIGMIHIMLPLFIFTLYGTVKAIDRTLLRAAANLGASPIRTFMTVFLPLSLPGVVTGAMLTFIICLGFYVTPQLLGGGNVTTIPMRVQQNILIYSDWGAASALGVVLIVIVALVMLTLRAVVGKRG